MKKQLLLALSALMFAPVLHGAADALAEAPPPPPALVEIFADTQNPVCEVPDKLFGIFIEDVNGAADGGLYAELIKNRSFEFRHSLSDWGTHGDVAVRSDDPAFKNNPRYVRMKAFRAGPRKRMVGSFLENKGFWGGMGIRKGETYRVSFYARAPKPLKIGLYLMSAGNEVIAKPKVAVTVDSNQWKRYETQMTASRMEPNGRFIFELADEGTVDVDHISMFPKTTWQGRENGLRPDLMHALYDLKPKHFRFPGGCIVEGFFLKDRYRWKNSVGAVEERIPVQSMWGMSPEKFVPGYVQSLGLGFYEYFLMAEDLGAEPMPILNCGLACQARSCEVEPLDKMQPYLQDALDLIEFANGPTDTKWGALRAQMGHPEPFNMKIIGIGNEQRGEVYQERLKLFVDLLRERHPDIEIVACSGDDARFDALNADIKRMKLQYRDEHYYNTSKWFFENAGKFDSYERGGPKVYLGEYAVCYSGLERKNAFNSALAEAAFMTGIERNCDVVAMACYAPLLANPAAHVWSPDLIFFNAFDRLLTCSYYVQKMFSLNVGDQLIKLSSPQTDLKGGSRLYASAMQTQEEIIIKLVNANPQPVSVSFAFPKTENVQRDVTIETLRSDNVRAENTFDDPLKIVPQTQKIRLAADGKNKLALEGNSVNVLKFKRAK